MQAARKKPNHFIGPSVLAVLEAIAAAGVLALVMGVGAKPAEAAPKCTKGKIAFASNAEEADAQKKSDIDLPGD